MVSFPQRQARGDDERNGDDGAGRDEDLASREAAVSQLDVELLSSM